MIAAFLISVLVCINEATEIQYFLAEKPTSNQKGRHHIKSVSENGIALMI